MRAQRASRRTWRRRVFLRVLLAVCVVVPVGVIAMAYRNWAANRAMTTSALGDWPAPKAGDRLLIFSPHCDDETLGLSGTMQQALAAGAEVRVVFMTNGDGFKYSAELQLRRFRVRPEGFVEFGMDRQREAVSALSVSGVTPKHVTFLGYPDRGLGNMWLYNWRPDNPYRSRFTGDTRSPYPNSYTPNAIYCGQSVLHDVTRIIREYRPTHVYSTHSNEDHPDHWATYGFVTTALRQLRDEEEERAEGDILAKLRPTEHAPPVQGLYLIHRGDWPVPRGYHPSDDLPPPSGLSAEADTVWRQAGATPQENQVKRAALQRYASQMRVMSGFLLSFVRRNELLGRRGPGPLTTVPDGAITIDGRSDDWENIPVSVHDPSGDSLPSDLEGAADLVSLRAARDSRRLYLRIETRKPISRRVAYEIYWYSLPNRGAGTRGVTVGTGRPLPPGVRASARRTTFEVSVPLPPGDALFLTVHSRYRGLTIDKTGLRILEPDAPEPGDVAMNSAPD